MRSRCTYEQRLLWLALAAPAPAVLVAAAWIWRGTVLPQYASEFENPVRWLLTLLAGTAWLGGAFAVRARVVRPLQTLANLLSALGDGDFSVRGRGARRGDALGEVILEVNALSRTLRDQRLGAVEASALLRTVMEEINLAVFAFDNARKLRLVNRAGERLLAQPVERLLGRTADELNLADCLAGEASRTFQAAFPGGFGRWGMRRSSFRQGGLPHQLLVIADLSKALRDEERQAWQRLLRVLGHELNNSLAPIKSISASLAALLAREPLPNDWRDDAARGLSVVSIRAEALSRFMESYSKLARLPSPKLQTVDVPALVRRVVALETRRDILVQPGPDVVIPADPDQLEQLLINLLRNAVEAVLETSGAVRLRWTVRGHELELQVEDDGPGLGNTTNLFVPFFTTKAGGSGIGLALSRQIAEGHNGSLIVQNRADASGCVASLRLPMHREDR